MIFSILWFFCTLRFQIYKYCPIITNHTSMERSFIQLSDDVYISIVKYWPLWLVLWSRVTFLSSERLKLIFDMNFLSGLQCVFMPERWTVVKYFYSVQVSVHYQCFPLENFYFTTFQSIILYFYCTTFHIKYNLILNYIRNLVLFTFTNLSNSKFYLRTLKM